MANCCAELKGELAQLRAEVSRLKPVDEEALIKKAVKIATGEIVPLIDQALAAAKAAYELAKTVEQIAKSAKAIAQAAEAIAKAVKPLLALIPLIPALITVAGLVGLILGFAGRIANVEKRVDSLESGLRALDSTVGRVINVVMELQNQLANLKLRKGDKGDRGERGLQGSPGYTPVKGRDYFDGVPGKNGYTPVKGRDYTDGARGKDGYTPVKNKDYYDGKDGKEGYTPIKNRDYFDGRQGEQGKVGDRGKEGYTPRKNIDYFDGAIGKNGKDGIAGKEGKPGYTPIKYKDYFDGSRGRDGLPGINGKDGVKGSVGNRGERGAVGREGKGIKGDRGIQGLPGKAEMPTDLSPVLSAIASLSSKLTIVSRQVDIIHESVNIEINGSIGSESCASGIVPFAYSGLGLVGIHNQIISVADTISRLHQDLCTLTDSTASGSTPPEEVGLLQRIYLILGGNVFYPLGTETTPRFITYPEVDIKADAEAMYNNTGTEAGVLVCNNLIDFINTSNAVSYYRMGLHELPASLPETLISKDEGFLGNLIPNANKDVLTLTRYITWFVERFDEVVGQWEIPIEIKDSDPSKPGDQPIGIKLPNIAEAIAEMFILCFQTNLNSETLLNMTMRVMGDGAADKKQNFVSYKLLQSLTDWAGYKQKDISMKLPLLFTLGKTKYEDILKESEEDVDVVEFDDKFGLEADLMRFREASAMLAAVHKRKIDPNGDVKAQVLKYLLDLLAKTDKVNKNDDDDNFEQFLKDVEVGFTTAPGMKDAVNPYGRPFVERPRIRDLNDYQPPTSTP